MVQLFQLSSNLPLFLAGGGACHKANGYMSEPEHGYDSDYASVDVYSGITPQKQ